MSYSSLIPLKKLKLSSFSTSKYYLRLISISFYLHRQPLIRFCTVLHKKPTYRINLKHLKPWIDPSLVKYWFYCTFFSLFIFPKLLVRGMDKLQDLEASFFGSAVITHQSSHDSTDNNNYLTNLSYDGLDTLIDKSISMEEIWKSEDDLHFSSPLRRSRGDIEETGLIGDITTSHLEPSIHAFSEKYLQKSEYSLYHSIKNYYHSTSNHGQGCAEHLISKSESSLHYLMKRYDTSMRSSSPFSINHRSSSLAIRSPNRSRSVSPSASLSSSSYHSRSLTSSPSSFLLSEKRQQKKNSEKEKETTVYSKQVALSDDSFGDNMLPLRKLEITIHKEQQEKPPIRTKSTPRLSTVNVKKTDDMLILQKSTSNGGGGEDMLDTSSEFPHGNVAPNINFIPLKSNEKSVNDGNVKDESTFEGKEISFLAFKDVDSFLLHQNSRRSSGATSSHTISRSPSPAFQRSSPGRGRSRSTSPSATARPRQQQQQQQQQQQDNRSLSPSTVTSASTISSISSASIRYPASRSTSPAASLNRKSRMLQSSSSSSSSLLNRDLFSSSTTGSGAIIQKKSSQTLQQRRASSEHVFSMNTRFITPDRPISASDTSSTPPSEGKQSRDVDGMWPTSGRLRHHLSRQPKDSTSPSAALYTSSVSSSAKKTKSPASSSSSSSAHHQNVNKISSSSVPSSSTASRPWK
jgi:hypothetical protein